MKAQTPELVNLLRGLLPNSVIVMVVIDPYKSQAIRNPKSIAHKYGQCMEDYLRVFGKTCEYKATFIPYGTNRYLAVV
jgi:branched-subunit amino acid transport protein AzlD